MGDIEKGDCVTAEELMLETPTQTGEKHCMPAGTSMYRINLALLSMPERG